MSANLNPADVVAWMREQAKRFTEMADQMEATFKLNGRPDRATATATLVKLEDRIRDLISDGSSRRQGQVAHELRVSSNAVVGAVDRDPRLTRNARGWISLQESEVNDG